MLLDTEHFVIVEIFYSFYLILLYCFFIEVDDQGLQIPLEIIMSSWWFRMCSLL
jgi:hypothetical protein